MEQSDDIKLETFQITVRGSEMQWPQRERKGQGKNLECGVVVAVVVENNVENVAGAYGHT